MDRISGLSDDLLIKILSYLPTRVAVSTCILSKRWECLWMWLPKLNFSTYFSDSECKRLRHFLNRNLPLHRAPVIESFCLKLCYPHFRPEDYKLWVVIAISRCLHKLKIDYYGKPKNANILPSSLYICKSLMSLKLYGGIRLDVPRMVCLPSLKTLQLGRNRYLDEDSLRRLLSICRVLEDLSVRCDFDSIDNMGTITVIVPSLQRLSLYIPYEGCFIDGLVIDAPSLKYLKLEDYHMDDHSRVIENMPKLEEAYLHVNTRFRYFESLRKSITSVKRLTLLCLETVHGDGYVFNQLEHLKLRLWNDDQLSLLVRLLEDSPNLQVLDIFDTDEDDELAAIDESFMSSLKNFNWSRYLGRPQKKDLEVYILDECNRKTKIF